MIYINKIIIIHLLLYLKIGELNSKSIIVNHKDNTKYDNVNNITTVYEYEVYNLNSQYERLSTEVSLEQSIITAEAIEITTPSIKTNGSWYEIIWAEDLLTNKLTSKAKDNYLNKNNLKKVSENLLTTELTTEEETEDISNKFVAPTLSADLLTTQRATEVEDNISYKFVAPTLSADLLTTQPATEAEDNILNNSDLDQLLMKFNGDDGNSCMLDCIKTALLWWKYPNGTLKIKHLNNMPHLDLSYRNIIQDDELYALTQSLDNYKLVAFSVAYNNLTTIPQHTLKYMGNSLKYLTLTGNQFGAQRFKENRNDTNQTYNASNHENVHYLNNHTDENQRIFPYNGEGTAWDTFPYLPALLELDISNCHIEYVSEIVFRNLTNLKRLYMSHNKILTIPFDTFIGLPALEYLDLSFTNYLDYKDRLTSGTLEALLNLIFGINIQPMTFKYLPKLLYLDLSHTKLTRNSALAFTYLGGRLEYLSLCYTSFPMISNDIFKNTALVGLDLSGNILAAYNILDDAFEGISDSLKYLNFENSNLKHLTWLKYLYNLRLLGLAGNNINTLTLDMFSSLSSLQLLDLSSNQVGNWYNRVFLNNQNLRVLSLRDNNLNIITSGMIKDFSLLEYLSLGSNDFVCDCLLRELVDAAAVNLKTDKCTRNLRDDIKAVINENIQNLKPTNYMRQVNITLELWQQHFKKLKSRNLNLKKLSKSKNLLKMRFIANNAKQCDTREAISSHLSDKLNGTSLQFQLIDYDEEHYWCFNETEKLKFVQINCQAQKLVMAFEEQLNNLTTYIIVCIATILGVCLIGLLIYWKRWYIRYYYSTLKTASLMSIAAKENTKKFNNLADHEPNMIYDIFISYCQNDRDWILAELMPNIEETANISICLHERDFQIGVTILDNIISCMERSRALMLIISSNFLLSHWCQFEMHLAQHRIFDVSREHLILVFLEDIPRGKRPKHLQYLMDVKTYIKWPGGKDGKGIRLEDRKLFWKRLKRSLINMGLSSLESTA